MPWICVVPGKHDRLMGAIKGGETLCLCVLKLAFGISLAARAGMELVLFKLHWRQRRQLHHTSISLFRSAAPESDIFFFVAVLLNDSIMSIRTIYVLRSTV